jgi:hypothetical protein
MTQPNDTPTSAPVSTVTKHIKIYSDNLIHDCIDRIIDACSYIDEGGEDVYEQLIELEQAAEKLSLLAQRKILVNSAEKLIKLSERKPNS